MGKADNGRAMSLANLEPPFQPGELRALKHGLYQQVLSPTEIEQVEEISAALRDLMEPAYSERFEPTIQQAAARIWRWKNAYAYLARTDIEAAATSLLKNLDVLERTMQRDLHSLGLTAQGAADLGMKWADIARSRRGMDLTRFDPERLDKTEREQLEALVRKAGGDA